jgi:hypothetical protein
VCACACVCVCVCACVCVYVQLLVADYVKERGQLEDENNVRAVAVYMGMCMIALHLKTLDTDTEVAYLPRRGSPSICVGTLCICV